MSRNSKLLSIFIAACVFALMLVLAGCGQQASSSAASPSASSASASASSAAASSSASSAPASASSAAASSSTGSEQAEASNAAADDEVTFTMKIDASDADKGLLYDSAVSAKKGATVYDALIDTGLDLSVVSSSGSTYVDGIADVVASEVGPNAGWTFTVNGESPNVGADGLVIANGDEIVWTFTSDYTAQ